MVYGRFDLEDNTNFYYACLIALALTMAGGAGVPQQPQRPRRHRDARQPARGGVVRDEPDPGALAGRSPISGGMAGPGRPLFAYSQHNVLGDSYDVLSSIFVFLRAASPV
jgi:hypothetical protein